MHSKHLSDTYYSKQDSHMRRGFQPMSDFRYVCTPVFPVWTTNDFGKYHHTDTRKLLKNRPKSLQQSLHMQHKDRDVRVCNIVFSWI